MGEKICAYKFLVRKSEMDYYDDLGVYARIILRRISKGIGCDGVDWINLVQGGDQ
jgi:hypothetical protein